LLDACRFACSGHPADVAAAGDVVFFTARGNDTGFTSSRGLYRTDGTRGGTELVVDGAEGILGGVFLATTVGKEIFFASYDAGSAGLSTLWKVDPATSTW
jgi:hypothetical protein